MPKTVSLSAMRSLAWHYFRVHRHSGTPAFVYVLHLRTPAFVSPNVPLTSP